MRDKYYDENLLRDWASGSETRIPAPLSVRSRWYRKIVGNLIARFSVHQKPHVLSVGAGTGVSELDLQHRGFRVTASDLSLEALAHCSELGLPTLQLDLTSTEIQPGLFNTIYADGVLGHLTEHANWLDIWARLHASDASCLLLSNDLSDTDEEANHTVFGEPSATFFRPIAGFFASSAAQSGLWQQHWSGVLRYRRPGRGIRRRELLVLHSATGVQRDDIESR